MAVWPVKQLLQQEWLFSEEGIEISDFKILFNVSRTSTIKKYADNITQRYAGFNDKNRVKYYQLGLEVLDNILFKQNLETKGKNLNAQYFFDCRIISYMMSGTERLAHMADLSECKA